MSANECFFVAGATGYTGREVVSEARGSGHRVVAHVRPDSASLAAWRERFEALGAAVDSTPWELAALSEQFVERQPTHIFALLGTTRHRGRQARTDEARALETYERVDYGLTVMLVEAALAAKITPRFVYLSSLGVSANARGAYLQARWRAEEHLRNSGLPYSIVRPSFISGPDRDESRVGERAATVVTDAALGALARLGAGGLRRRYASMSGKALGRALVRVATDPKAEGRVLTAAELRGD